jgi:hypothetical protein
MDDDGKPTFDELRGAMMPPGADKEALWSALKDAHQTGGFAPGGAVPDISSSPPPGYERLLHMFRTGHLTDADRPRIEREIAADEYRHFAASGPAVPDPFPPGAAPAAALHEMFTDFLAAGFTEDQATAILGKMLAAYGRES